ncbi:MAG TPA: patatin-like phospholipase family protein [Thermoleophilaceae bacterium]|nr:patatin-like phospholipase family protein [Thermoleophilaceae bacterium]
MPGERHPVVEVVRRRAREGSEPGRRHDPHRVALVLEGGGMRGVVSAGMTAALERLGLANCFDLVVGASAGAINGAALIAGVARAGAAAYHGPLASRRFVNPARALRGRPVIDVSYVLDYASTELDGGRHERVLTSRIALHCVAVDVETAKPVTFAGMRSKDELYDAVLASSRMPWAGGPPVEVAGRRYVDGGLGAPIPVAEALAAGATHVLVLQTRPHGVRRRSASRLGDVMIVRHLRRLNPALVALYQARVEHYEQVVADIARRSLDGGGPPHVLGLRPPAGTQVVGQLERRSEVLAAAARDAERLVEQTLRLAADPRAAATG